jgi:hypothetical protein
MLALMSTMRNRSSAFVPRIHLQRLRSDIWAFNMGYYGRGRERQSLVDDLHEEIEDDQFRACNQPEGFE